jgi:ABC-type Zn uptake system ZnuABC Zn-binding protein ZnuA
MLKTGYSLIVPLLLLTAALLFFCGCLPDKDPRAMAVTTSWLECCVRDLAGPRQKLVRLTPPGSCPGHFDLKPSAAASLRSCRLLLRFNFQQSLDSRLGSSDVEVVSINAPEGLCIPDNYLHSCKQIYKVLCKTWPERKSSFDQSLEDLENRMDQLEEDIHQMVHEAGISGATVVTSGHQAEFARWLGFQVIATYSGAETTSPRELKDLIEHGQASDVRLIIANLQEGRAMADSLAYHLKTPVACFSNFPAMTGQEKTFEDLVRNNANALIEAARNSP